MTAPYSILHFLVDGICAFAMFGHFAAREDWYLNILLYNFCAFALQMPLGAVLDGLNGQLGRQKYEPSFVYAVVGVILTFIGAVTHPVVLGIGNAMFHLGGGVGTIHEDEGKGWHGKGLGVFVAPGALGLYLGTLLAKSGMVSPWSCFWPVGMVAILCLMWSMLALRKSISPIYGEFSFGAKDGTLWIMLGCLAVVILRSYIGMSVSFSWKTTLIAGTLAVLAVVLGKVAGGFTAAGFGVRPTVAVSLVFSALCFLLSDNMAAGVLALFLFNMTMPITLYLLVQRMRGLPGFAFGLLTFGLFLGFLPSYFGVSLPVNGRTIGCVGSLVSLVILWICTRSDSKS
ncbi:MAG: hypothetical protein IJZ82_01505 [Lachnospiraceae bacterium]|nr:hypothetical protein [Lachnospiraceae bacterium]